MSRRKVVVFSVAAVMLSLVFTTALLVGVDLYLHKRHGINMWGYRGPVVARKQQGERRVAVLGESTAWGYGVRWDRAFPAYLERTLEAARRRAGQGAVSVVNLAYNNEGAYSYYYTLQDYKYLDYDVALFYSGYNDLGGPNRQVIRHQSWIFRRTGYWPLIPVMLPRKATDLRDGGEYPRKPERTVFRPDLASRATAEAMDAIARITRSLEHQVGRLSSLPEVEPAATPALCGEPWAHYCEALGRAVGYALDRGKRVVVVTQPYLSDDHVEQQRAMLGMLRDRFGLHPRFSYVNLGRAVDLRDPALAYDGMHLTPAGNERIAERLVEPLLGVLEPGTGVLDGTAR